MAVQREWFEVDYYKTLGVSSSAGDKDITRAYRKLAKQFHPDANQGERAAEERFKEISTAYDVLGNAAKRKEYDEVRRMAASGVGYGGGSGASGNPFAGGQGAGAGNFRFDDLGDLFGGLFNRGAQRQRGSGPQRGDDLETELQLSFLDAVNGVTTSVNLTSDVACNVCHGSGATPGTQPKACPTCGGSGALADNQGVFSFSRPCTTCQGSGRVIETPCKQCRGTGVQRRSRQVKVRIPPGVRDGQRIVLKGKGSAGRNGGPPGNLYVRTHVAVHSLFGRDGNDLTLTVPVTYPELVVGAAVTVPTLTDPVTVRVQPGTKSGAKLRVRGRGIAATGKGVPGDLLVTVELVVPAHPGEEEKQLIEKLGEKAPGDALRRHLGVER